MTEITSRSPVVLAFAGPTGAEEALRTFKQLEATEVLRLNNAAVISRDATGTLSIHETGDLSPIIKWALVGVASVAGFIAGTLWRGVRVGFITGYAVGQSGAILVTVFDRGFSNMYLEHLAEDVSADTSLMVASVEFKSQGMADVIQSRLAGARIVRPAAPSLTLRPPAMSI